MLRFKELRIITIFLLEFLINDALVFASESKENSIYTNQPKKVESYTISGYVSEMSSSETLIGVNIYDKKRGKGTATNSFGYYTLTLEEGETELSFSYVGHKTHKIGFHLDKDTIINVSLSSDSQLKELVVLSHRKETGINSTGMGRLEIPISQIKNTPSILGETDLLKTIQLMPGVQPAMEGFSGILVRGGGPDQNLILMDGIPIYNIDHMLGIFSVFTSEAVKNVTLYKSSFPARFGGRLSSIVDINTNDGDMKNYHGTLSVGFLTSKVHLEGPIIKDKTSFCFTARRTYADLIARPFMKDDEKFNYYFYDINAKVNHKFSDKSRLYLSIYNGKDYYDYNSDRNYDNGSSSNNNIYVYNDKINFNWGNTIGAIRWNYVFNNKLFSNSTLSYNHYNMTMGGRYKEEHLSNEGNRFYNYSSDYKSGISDISLKSDFDYNPIPSHQIKFGFSFTNHTFKPEITTSKITEKENNVASQDTLYSGITNNNIPANEVSAYGEDNFNIGKNLSLNAGVHLSLFNTDGKNYLSAQPRFSARYTFGNGFAVKGAFTQMSQFVHLLSSTQISLPTDLWVPVTKNIKPMLSEQYSFGLYNTALKGWEFSVEGYYKSMHNVLEYQEGTSFFGYSGGWQEKVEMGEGRSFGAEFLAQKTFGKTTGWIAYTIAKSDRIFKDGSINNGNRFPYKYDRRHNFNICLNHSFSKKIDTGITWVYTSGGTATIAQKRTGVLIPGNDSPDVDDYVSKRNNYRLPPSHRLNFSINFHRFHKRGESIWNISVYNMYNAMNPNLVSSEREYTEHSYVDEFGEEIYYFTSKIKIKKLTLLPCVPSITYTYKF
ncbi:MAG: TonB-dependent receptor [Bacteroidales bacterium]|nr:TonB-dependent receptor [Bacteroidales bacterium]